MAAMRAAASECVCSLPRRVRDAMRDASHDGIGHKKAAAAGNARMVVGVMDDSEWTVDDILALDEPDESIQQDFGLYALTDYTGQVQEREFEEHPSLNAVEHLSSNSPSEDEDGAIRDDTANDLKRRRTLDEEEPGDAHESGKVVDSNPAEQDQVYFFTDAPFGEEVLQVSCGDRSGFIILGPHVKHLRKYTNASSDCIRSGTSLLGTPFEQIRHEATSMLVQEVLDKREAASRPASVISKPHGGCELWVNKYKPTSFLHLLSDENTNRLVLKWIKSWDSYVFGKKKALVPAAAPTPVNLTVNTMASAAGVKEIT